MIISEEEKEDIRKKYEDNISQKVLNYLKRRFPVYDFKLDWMETPIKQIYIDEKLYDLRGNKKDLVNRINLMIEDDFTSIEKSVLRRTIKYYLDFLR